MMQQMMSNPQMMQGMMGAGPAPQPASPAEPQAAMAGNPMAAMMQQMMSNPQMMQQTMQMRQALGMGAPGGGMFGMPAMPEGGMFGGLAAPAATPAVAGAGAGEMTDEVARMRFAAQLTQLAGMGFTNEALCLQALRQHNGRVDAAIDTLLSAL